MTKSEMLFGGIKTDEQIFEMSVADILLRCRELSVMLGVSVYDSSVWNYHQKREIEFLVGKLEEFQKKARSWKWRGRSDQLNLDLPLDK